MQHELADPYELHRTVSHAFPDANYKDNEPSGILFRVDLHPHTRIPTLLVQSRQKPDWSFLTKTSEFSKNSEVSELGFKNYLLGENELPLEVKNPDYRELNLQLNDGQVLAFRLRANPTVKKTINGEGGKARLGILKEDKQREWLENKFKSAGAALINVNIVNERFTHGKLFKEKEKEQRMNFLSIQFDGVLQVKEPEKFINTIYSGFGSAKGLGFGLLSLARA